MFQAPKRLLLVDDDSLDRQQVTRLLGGRFQVVQATTAAEALAACETGHPDCVLVDYRLPDMDGVDLVRKLRPTQAAMIMLTGEGDETVAVEAMKAGAADYVAKDQLTTTRLVTAITTACERSQLKKHLAETREELEEFAAIAAHDLKSPLATIVGNLQVVASASSDLPDQEKRFLERSRELASGLIEMVDQLIRYTRTGRTTTEFEEVDLRAAAASALERLQQAIRSSGGVVEIGELPTVQGVEQDLVQLLQNLIGNALKFSDKDSPRVKVYAEASDDERHSIVSVEDNGIGIDEAHRESVFAPLKRLHNESQYEGYGLGLATCRKIVMHHGGRVWIDSADNGGCVVRFTLCRV